MQHSSVSLDTGVFLGYDKGSDLLFRIEKKDGTWVLDYGSKVTLIRSPRILETQFKGKASEVHKNQRRRPVGVVRGHHGSDQKFATEVYLNEIKRGVKSSITENKFDFWMANVFQKEKVIRGDVPMITKFVDDLVGTKAHKYLPHISFVTKTDNISIVLKRDRHVTLYECEGKNNTVMLAKMLFQYYSEFYLDDELDFDNSDFVVPRQDPVDVAMSYSIIDSLFSHLRK